MMSHNNPTLDSQLELRNSSNRAAIEPMRNGHPLHLHPGIRQAFRDLAQQMIVGLDADLWALFGWDDDQQRLVFLQGCDKDNRPMTPWNGYASDLIASPAMQSVLNSGLSLSISLEDNCSAAEGKVLTHFRSHALVLVPVGSGCERIGVIALLLSSGQSCPDERSMRLLDLLAAQGMKQIEQRFLRADHSRDLTRKSRRPWQEDGFLLAVSRDLQAPLGAIVGLVESMQTGVYGELPSELTYPLNRVLRNASSLVDVVGELAEWGRGGAGHFMLYPEWLDLPSMLQSLAEGRQSAIRNTAPDRHPRPIQLHCPGDLPLVFVDISRIRQVVDNLLLVLQNIAPAGQLLVTSRVIRGQNDRRNGLSLPDIKGLPDGTWVQVSVASMGAEVAPQMVQALTDTCAQPSGQEDTWPAGALGLVIAKRLLALHGSILWVTPCAELAPQAGENVASRPGLTFSFALPVQPQQVWLGRRRQGVEPIVQRRPANRPSPPYSYSSAFSYGILPE